MSDIHPLAAQHNLISPQVNKQQVSAILRELEMVIDSSLSDSVVEFGCYSGTTSLFIRRLLDARQDNREFHVYDSFEGLPAKAMQDASPVGEQFVAGELSVTKKQFIQEFKKAGLQLPVIHKGWFNELTDTDVPGEIAFAFLDGDFYDSIADSLYVVLPRMAAGGTIIIDDFAREALPGVAKAVADFAPQLVNKIRVEHNLGIIHL